MFDHAERTCLLIQAKWLIRPDYIREVLSRDDELVKGIQVAKRCAVRVGELGLPWLFQLFGLPAADGALEVRTLVANRDFLPGGWVHDEQVPVVDADFLSKFVRSDEFTGLLALHTAAGNFDRTLEHRYRVTFGSDEIKVGFHTVRLPTIVEG